MRSLGIQTNSEGVLRRIRRDVLRLKLDVSHFKGSRTWDDATLVRAVAAARTWDDVLTSLGINDPGKETRLRIQGHATRLGLDVSHLEFRNRDRAERVIVQPDLRHLREAGPSIAAAWFLLRGFTVSLPIEPAVFDLLVSMPGGVKRVQAKTTTGRNRDSWLARVGRRPYSVGNQAPLTTYDPDDIDLFFIVDGDLNVYVIPSHDVAGRTTIMLHRYTRFIVGNAKGMVADAPPPASAA